MLDRRALLAAVPAFAVWPARATEAPAALETYERETGGRIGLYAESIATGAKIVWRADERFVMCSTFKASLAACVLARIDRGQDNLQSMVPYGPEDLQDHAPVARQHLAEGALSVGDMCAAAVEISDNTCANKLMARIGGPVALTAFWRGTGDAISRLDHYEPELNRSPPGDPHDTTTPAAMAGSLRRFALRETLSSASRERFIDWMLNCKTGGNRLRGGLPKTWKIGNKTGNNGKDAFSDIAVAWPKPDTPLLICAYTQGGHATSQQVETVFAEIGHTVAHRLV